MLLKLRLRVIVRARRHWRRAKKIISQRETSPVETVQEKKGFRITKSGRNKARSRKNRLLWCDYDFKD